MKRFVAFVAGLFFTLSITLAVLVYSYRDPVLKVIVEFAVTEATGFRTEIDTLSHEWPAVFTLRGVKMDNPSGYSKRLFATSPYFYIEFDLRDILKRRSFHIREWRLRIEELHLEKNKEGATNGALLKSIKKLAGVDPNPPPDAPPGPSFPFQLDHIEVSIDRITYKDKTGVLPKKITSGLFLPATVYENVTSFRAMIDQARDKVLELAGSKKIVMLSPFYLEGSLKKAATTVKDTVAVAEKTPVVAQTGKILKTTAYGAKEKIGEAAEATKEQLGGLIRIKPLTPEPLSGAVEKEQPLEAIAQPSPAAS